jgi:hypothetical protein
LLAALRGKSWSWICPFRIVGAAFSASSTFQHFNISTPQRYASTIIQTEQNTELRTRSTIYCIIAKLQSIKPSLSIVSSKAEHSVHPGSGGTTSSAGLQGEDGCTYGVQLIHLPTPCIQPPWASRITSAYPEQGFCLTLPYPSWTGIIVISLKSLALCDHVLPPPITLE